MKLKLNTLATTLLALLVLASCGTGSKKNNSADFEKAKTLGEQIRSITRNLPSPTQIPYELQATGAEYNQSLVNPLGMVDEYSAQMDKAALNLGVYAADIGYLCSYEKAQESLDYLTACKNLADNLGVTGTFDPAILRRFEANIGNKDSLAILLNEAIARTDDYLNGSSQSKLGALMVTGSFVESLYLSTGLIKTYPNDDFKTSILTRLIIIVLKQRASVAEVSKMLKALEQTGPIPVIIQDLDELEAAYTVLNMDEQIKNNTSKLEFTEQTLSGITKVVEKLRADIVK